MKRLAQYLIALLTKIAYEKITVEDLNKKVIEAVPGLLIDGKQAYQFANPADMPEGRYVNFLHFKGELFSGLNRENNIELFKKIASANNEGDKTTIGAVSLMAIDFLENCTPIEAYYNMASLIYFNKDEDLKTWDEDYNTRKVEEFKAKPNQDFFLRNLSMHLKRYGISSPANISDYLSMARTKMKVLMKLISEQKESSRMKTGKKV